MGDEDLEAEIITLFNENAVAYVEALGKALEEDGEAWYRAAHKLKGLARSIGAGHLAQVAEQSETLEIPCPERQQFLGEIRRLVDATAKAFDAYQKG